MLLLVGLLCKNSSIHGFIAFMQFTFPSQSYARHSEEFLFESSDTVAATGGCLIIFASNGIRDQMSFVNSFVLGFELNAYSLLSASCNCKSRAIVICTPMKAENSFLGCINFRYFACKFFASSVVVLSSDFCCC